MKHAYNTLIKYKYAIVAIFFMAGISSCQKEVHINLDSAPPKVVVEGAIESGLPPYVVLTSTIGFFSNVDLSTLQNSFLHDAHVTVSDGNQTITLKEYALDTGVNNKFYVYSIAPGDTMVGQLTKTYTLSITYNGTTYTATTTIPNPKSVDSMWFDEPEFKRDKTPATAKELFVNYTDPDTIGDYVRCFTKRTGQQMYYPSAVFSDEIVNGKLISKISILAGYPEDAATSDNVNRDSLIYFFPGDTVTLKWSFIDKAVYKFWNSVEFAKSSVGNPFSSPINPITNISNGGLGVWAGYGNTFRTLIVPN